MPDTREELDLAVAPLQDIFREAWDIRGSDWLALLQRELPVLVPDHVKENAKKVPVIMPIMEDNLIADVTIMTGNEPRIRIVDQEGTKESATSTENLRMHKEVWRHRFNHAGEVEKAIATHFVWPDGVAVARLDARKPGEYEGAEEGSAYNSAREEHFRTQEEDKWKLQVRNPRACAWWPLVDFREFVEDVEVDLAECRQLHRREDKVDAATLLGLIKNTPGEPHDNNQSTTNTGTVAHAVFYEYLDE